MLHENWERGCKLSSRVEFNVVLAGGVVRFEIPYVFGKSLSFLARFCRKRVDELEQQKRHFAETGSIDNRKAKWRWHFERFTNLNVCGKAATHQYEIQFVLSIVLSSGWHIVLSIHFWPLAMKCWSVTVEKWHSAWPQCFVTELAIGRPIHISILVRRWQFITQYALLSCRNGVLDVDQWSRTGSVHACMLLPIRDAFSFFVVILHQTRVVEVD